RQDVPRRRQRRRVAVMLMNPGVTTSPDASISVAAVSRDSSPSRVMRPAATPTSARYAGRPGPSSTEPPRTMRSNGAGRGGGEVVVDGPAHAATARSVMPSARACMPPPEYRADARLSRRWQNTLRMAADTAGRIHLSVADARELSERAMRGFGYDPEEARILAAHALDA